MEEIRNKTNALLKSVEAAIDWSNMNEDEVVRNGFEKPFKSIRRELSIIQESLLKRPSIAIFGQSQVGKSYLVQNLAKPFDNKYLKIKVSDGIEDLNFLNDMNPDGGKESTGLVTRFTTKKVEEDKDFPFEIELFTQLDVAAMLTNAYWSDIKDFDESVYDFDKSEIKSLWEDLDTHKNQPGATEDEVYFFYAYIKEYFKDSALIRKLTDIGYFTDLVKILPKVAAEKRWEILKFLWGQNKFITQLFRLLSEGIQTLRFQKNARVSLEALTPQSKTILDVERVREILEKETHDTLHVKLNSGEVGEVSRSILSALTKEVQLQIAHDFPENEPQSFLNTSDILDFPGSKSREKIPLNVFNDNTSEQKLQLLIRGKVSYLFDSYSNKLGVSTLLYCMDDNPPEEKEAPSRLFNWVKKYIGNNQENREVTLNKTREVLNKIDPGIEDVSPLLVVFTKFNQELNKVLPGRETNIATHDSKWLARFKENFINFMSSPVEDKWLTHWRKEESDFKFVFPIRDPLYSQATFEGFDELGEERRIRPERVEAMRAIETSFTGSDIVNKHTLDPHEIWDELSSPNGTGILFLSKHLKNSAHPEVTRTRLELLLENARKKLLDILKPYQVSGNLNEDLKAARKKGMKSFTALVAMANLKSNAFSDILEALVVSDSEIWNLLYDHIFNTASSMDKVERSSSDLNIVESFADMGVLLKEGMSQDDILAQLREIYYGLDDEEIAEIIEEMFEVRLNELAYLISSNKAGNSEGEIADLIIAFWLEKMTDLALDEQVFKSVSVDQKETFRALLSEITKSRKRLDLKAVISSFIKDIKKGAISIEDIDLVASCSAATLNKFLFSAGWEFAAEEHKPIMKQSDMAIFSNYGRVYEKTDLDYSPDENKQFFKQWSLGVKEIYEENVKFDYNMTNRDINTLANHKLDEIINQLQ